MVPLLLLQAALAAPDLYIDGACPGAATVEARFATPGGRVAFVRGTGPGESTIPSGVCQGATVPLTAPALATIATADASGRVLLNPTLAQPACGLRLSAVDLSTCTSSAPMAVTPPTGFDLSFADGYGWISTLKRTGTNWAVIYHTNQGPVLARLTGGGVVQRITPLPFTYISGLTTIPQTGALALWGTLGPDYAMSWLDAQDQPLHTTEIVNTPATWVAPSATAPDGSTLALRDGEALFAADGTLLWSNQPPPDTRSRDVRRGAGTWLIAGQTEGISSDIYVRRLGDDGATLTEDRYDAGTAAIGFRAIELPGGSVMLLAGTNTNPGRCIVAHLSATGAPYWAVQLEAPGFPGWQSCSEMEVARDGVLVGGALYDGFNNAAFVASVDFEGEVHWARTYGVGGVTSIAAAPDGGLGIATMGVPTATRALSTDAVGRGSCSGTEITLTSTPTTLTWSPQFPTGLLSTPPTASASPATPVGNPPQVNDQCP